MLSEDVEEEDNTLSKCNVTLQTCSTFPPYASISIILVTVCNIHLFSFSTAINKKDKDTQYFIHLGNHSIPQNVYHS